MIVQIKKLGTSKGIIIPKIFLKYAELSEGDWVDISDMFKVDKKKRKINRSDKNE